MLEDPRADLGVAADLAPLVGVERAGLLQDRVGDAELADVVQHARRRGGARGGRRSQPRWRPVCSASWPTVMRVARGAGVAQVERLGEEHRGRELLAGAARPRRRAVPSPSSRPSVRGRTERRGPGRGAWRRRARGAPRGGPPRRCRGSCRSPRGRSRPRPGPDRSVNSSRTAARRRSATARAAMRSVSRRTMANSAPSSRVGTSEPRVERRSTPATRRSTSSPVSSPSSSVTRRKSSRSQTRTETASLAAMSSSIRGSRSRRLRRPVTGSWTARWRRCSSWRVDSTALIAWLANARSACRPSIVGTRQSSGSSTHTMPVNAPSRSWSGTISQWLRHAAGRGRCAARGARRGARAG